MTKAELIRRLQPGAKLRLIYRGLGASKNIGVERSIIKAQSNGIWLEQVDNPKPSWLSFPESSLIEPTEGGFAIYEPGLRELTDSEKSILANRPRNPELEERDLMTDGSTTFWMDKKYFRDNGADWYWGWSKGKYYHPTENKMRDKKIKGKKSLEYEFV